MKVQSEYILELLHKKDVINNWISSKYQQNPLIIYGMSGSGKTSLANYILRDQTVVHINLDFCKGNQSLETFLELSLFKKSITMMFDQKNTNKAIIFDDLNYIQEYDKKLFKDIIKFSKRRIKDHPVIYIFNHIQHKSVQIIYKYSIPLHLNFTKEQFKLIIQKYYSNKVIHYDELIEKSNYNFHNIKINIHLYKGDYHEIQKYDTKEDELFTFIRKIYPYNIEELYRSCVSDYNIISLHILQNCIQWIFEKKGDYQKKITLINEIYKCNHISDNFLSLIHKNNDWQLLDHILSFSIVLPIYNMRTNNIQITSLVYNNYISKSIIYTYNTKLLMSININIYHLSFLFRLIFCYTKIDRNKGEYLLKIKHMINEFKITRGIIEKFIKYFDNTISKNDFKQLFKELNLLT